MICVYTADSPGVNIIGFYQHRCSIDSAHRAAV